MESLGTTSIPKGFDSIFIEVKDHRNLNLENKNCLRFFHLDISNNMFNYEGLYQYLQRNIGRYVFSRATVDRLKADGDADAIGLKAIELLRTAKNENDKGAGGELGEILLYLLLEQKLNAPKILSKVELKTSGNQYVFGSDAVHLLPLGDTQFQLVLGESKIKGNLSDAVDDAFSSIKKVAEDPSNEIRLIEKNIFLESFSDEQAEFIKSLIVPQKRNHDFEIDNAFGIFLGYTLGIDHCHISNSDFRKAASDKIHADINSVAEYIQKQIKKTGLSGYSFYFFIIPFNDAPKDRASIMKKLRGEN